MRKLNLKVGSITYAMKAKEILQKRGISSEVKKNLNPAKGDGCGYSILVYNATESTENILRLAGIDIIEATWI